MTGGFRDMNELNLWTQWVTTFAVNHDSEVSIAEADRILEAFRDRMTVMNLMPKPGRA